MRVGSTQCGKGGHSAQCRMRSVRRVQRAECAVYRCRLHSMQDAGCRVEPCTVHSVQCAVYSEHGGCCQPMCDPEGCATVLGVVEGGRAQTDEYSSF